jgi:beta-barrel assembly-enhancing protease
MTCTLKRNCIRLWISVFLLILLPKIPLYAGGSEKKPKDYLKNVGTGLNLFSQKEERSMGERYSGELNGKLSLLNGAQSQAYVESLGRQLVLASRAPDLDCRFFVVNTREVNAYALPGCYVYVNRGLIDLAVSEGELAGVMAHEIGHVVGRHAVKQVSKQLVFLGAVAGASAAVNLKSEKWATVIATAGGFAALLANLKYSRDDEHQADALAAETLQKAGYDPHNLVSFFQRMDPAKSTGKIDRAMNLLSTHPPIPDREMALSQQISQMSYNPSQGTHPDDTFQTYKGTLAGFPFPPPNREVTLSNALAAVGLAEASKAEGALEPIGSRDQAQTVLEVPGNTVWLDTGLEIHEGDMIEFWAEGEIFIKKNSDLSCDPSGVFGSGKGFFKPISRLNTGALVGRIVTEDKSEPFPIGTHRVLRAGVSGKLELGINDDNNFDNRGSYKVWLLTR